MFFKCKNEDEVKKLFRQLSLKLHPDAGGCQELFILLKESHENALKTLKERKEKPKQESKPEPKKEETVLYPGKYQLVSENILAGDTRIKIIQDILAFAKKNLPHPPEFVQSVAAFFLRRYYVTASQYNSLVKIYYAYDINKE